jgi:zinc protease
MSRVRSDEGLAYSAGSGFPGGVYYPLTFTASFQSKSRTVPYAASIVLQEMEKMTATPPTDQELHTSKRSYIDQFPGNFATKGQVAGLFAQEEFTGRYAQDPDFWKKFRERIDAITPADVERVAKKYLEPKRSVILIVGQKNEISLGMPEHPVQLKDLSPGPIIDLPLRDPYTMQPIPVSRPAVTTP